MKPTTHFLISQAWLHDCGFRHYAGPEMFEVLRSWRAGRLTMVEVRGPGGRPWVLVADWRGRFV